MGRKRSDEFPLYFGSTQGSETPALCALAGDRKLCELGEGDQAAVDVASLQASRFALRSTTGNAARGVKILEEAIGKTFKDREFHKEYQKIVGDDADPIMPEAMAKVVKETPRDLEVIDTLKK